MLKGHTTKNIVAAQTALTELELLGNPELSRAARGVYEATNGVVDKNLYAERRAELIRAAGGAPALDGPCT